MRLTFLIILRVIFRAAFEEVDDTTVQYKQAPEPVPLHEVKQTIQCTGALWVES
jgi:hypothetical protein